MPSPESQKWILEKMVPVFPIKVFVDKTEQAFDLYEPPPTPPLEQFRNILRIEAESQKLLPASTPDAKYANPRLKIAGFGGQGVLVLGLGVAQCGMLEGRKVSWLPSYGPEMRGGTAHCHVNISDEEIGSPLVSRPTVLMALNQPSLEKFESEVVPGGLLIVNSSMVPVKPKRSDVEVFEIPASEIAVRLGNPRMANMVMLGAYAGYTGMLGRETCLAALETVIKKSNLIGINEKAINEGFDFGRAQHTA
jgi:Pyruvate/2-oxoacid:ferredoxin oxidoreductase gamma subunit